MLQLIAELEGVASIGRFLLGWWASSQRAKIVSGDAKLDQMRFF